MESSSEIIKPENTCSRLKLFGGFVFCWGLFVIILYAFRFIELQNMAAPFLPAAPEPMRGKGASSFFMFLTAVQMVFGAALMLGGYGIAKKRRWGRKILFHASRFILLYNLLFILVIGLLAGKTNLAVDLPIASISLWFLRRKETIQALLNEGFSLQKEKRLYFIDAIVAFAILAGYAWALAASGIGTRFLFHNPRMIDYRALPAAAGEQTKSRETKLPGFSISLPENFMVRNFSLDGRHEYSVLFTFNDMQTAVQIGNRTVFDYFTHIGMMLGITNTEDFANLIVRERLGFILLFLKPAMGNGGLFDSVAFAGWRGFVASYARPDHNDNVADMYLWRKDGRGSASVAVISKQAPPPAQIMSAVSSLAPEQSGTYDKKFYAEGLDLFQKGEYERAKLMFINALYTNPENGDYFYALGKAFEITGCVAQAKMFLKQAEEMKIAADSR